MSQQHKTKETECKLKKNKYSNIPNQTLQGTGTIKSTLVNSNAIHITTHADIGNDIFLWFWFPALGFISHDRSTCCSSSGWIKGKEISRIIRSPQNGHSLAIASSSCDRSCT